MKREKFRVDVEFYREKYLSGNTPWPSDTPDRVFARFLRKIKKDLSFSPVCVDVGCGEGRNTVLLKRIFPASKVIGFDIIMEALVTAKNKVKNFREVLLCQADVFFSPIKSNTADIIIDFGVFHHIRKRDTGRYKKEIRNILKNGGYFLISVFSKKFKHTPDEKRRRDFIYHRKHYDRFFTKKLLESEFRFLKPVEFVETGKKLQWFIYGLFKKEVLKT